MAEIQSAMSHFINTRGSYALIGSSGFLLLVISLYLIPVQKAESLSLNSNIPQVSHGGCPQLIGLTTLIREEETVVIGSHEPTLAVVKEWKVN